VLHYDVGQYYKTHHDYGAEDNGLACGPRILTFFLYLSDVEKGGETNFPNLNIAVKPKRGRALLWPSVLDSDVTAIDIRTRHEAKPVIQGVKYAANAWIHLYNYAIPNLWACTGSIDEMSEDDDNSEEVEDNNTFIEDTNEEYDHDDYNDEFVEEDGYEYDEIHDEM
jgi:prolyl 4-hydroxylase